MAKPKPKRVRDPIHNLIEFNSGEFESTLWRVIQTPPFQRLRRIRQLGFSEFVFPGATHTRFAHSVGVFHTARQLMNIVEKYANSHEQQFRTHQAEYSLTAALLHDVGHGMFSHAFEALGKEFGWPMARHEEVSQRLIRDSEISQTLDDAFGKGYAGNVADIIARDIPGDLYGSVVSSQFDADRLDYMQRDRFMTGVQSSGVDPTWLLANLEVAEVPIGADETETGTVETLVLGPKAVQTAESYVLGLFHLYPNVYLHKATRGAEMVFQALMRRLVRLRDSGGLIMSGLPANHPIVRFLEDPAKLETALALDDTVLWGALPMLVDAEDREVGRLSFALRERRLPRCIDIRARADEELAQTPSELPVQRQARVKVACDAVVTALRDREAEQPDCSGRILVDRYSRNPYKRYQESKTPLNQILIRLGSGPPQDMCELSPTIQNAEPFNLCRAYHFRDDMEAGDVIENVMRTKLRENLNAGS